MRAAFDTPPDVARALARFVPRKAKLLLDPAVGLGALVRPIAERLKTFTLVCVDTDPKRLSDARNVLQHVGDARFICADFLKWCLRGKNRQAFDCIVMNPPFLAKKVHFVSLRIGGRSGNVRRVPIEFAFVYNSVGLLKPRGRLLAIVPPSVVSGEAGKWIRKYLMDSGRVKVVHELSPRTFIGIDGPMYLLVFEKTSRQVSIRLRNHRLVKPDELFLRKKCCYIEDRFDYSFHDANRWLEKIKAIKECDWHRLGDISDCWRGEVASPTMRRDVLHTTNFNNITVLPQRDGLSWIRPAEKGDLLVRRVGRGCARSFKLNHLPLPMPCSDCVIIIRPLRDVSNLSLLFALRAMMTSAQGQALVEKGLGAKYLAIGPLRNLQIPLGLSAIFPQEFASFQRSIADGHFLDAWRWDLEIMDLSKAPCQQDGLSRNESR